MGLGDRVTSCHCWTMPKHDIGYIIPFTSSRLVGTFGPPQVADSSGTHAALWMNFGVAVAVLTGTNQWPSAASAPAALNAHSFTRYGSHWHTISIGPGVVHRHRHLKMIILSLKNTNDFGIPPCMGQPQMRFLAPFTLLAFLLAVSIYGIARAREPFLKDLVLNDMHMAKEQGPVILVSISVKINQLDTFVHTFTQPFGGLHLIDWFKPMWVHVWSQSNTDSSLLILQIVFGLHWW